MKITPLLALFNAGPSMAQAPGPVKVDGGLLQGTSENGLTVYRGIRFAPPPVGDLRWRAPNPAWPAFSDTNPVLMYFAQTPHAGVVPSAEALKALDPYFAWPRTAEGEAAVK